MQEQSLDLAKRTALAALPWVAGLTAILTITNLIPCCNLLLFPLGALGLGYLITSRLGIYPTPEMKHSSMLTIGATIGQALSLAFLAFLSRSGSGFDLLPGGLGLGVSLLLGLLFTIGGGLVFGTLFGFLGSLIALGQQRPRESYY